MPVVSLLQASCAGTAHVTPTVCYCGLVLLCPSLQSETVNVTHPRFGRRLGNTTILARTRSMQHKDFENKATQLEGNV